MESDAVDALIYDAYGTLFDVYSISEKCESCFPGQGAALSEIWRAKQLEYTWLCSLMGRYRDFRELTKASLRFACSALQLELRSEICKTLLKNYLHLTPYAEVPAVLRRLGTTHKQAILSNATPGMVEPLVTNNSLQDTFTQIMSVDALGIFKPAPQVYRFATEQLGVRAERTGFISSNCWDALGAKAFGFRVFWINRFKRPLDILGITPDHEIDTLETLEKLLSAS